MNTDAESALGALVNRGGRTDQSVAPLKKKAGGAKPKTAHAAKTAKAPRRPTRSSRAASRTEKLVCRYCGSDDFAPSFKKRRDARCRACFKKRYGSAPQDKKTARVDYIARTLALSVLSWRHWCRDWDSFEPQIRSCPRPAMDIESKTL